MGHPSRRAHRTCRRAYFPPARRFFAALLGLSLLLPPPALAIELAGVVCGHCGYRAAVLSPRQALEELARLVFRDPPATVAELVGGQRRLQEALGGSGPAPDWLQRRIAAPLDQKLSSSRPSGDFMAELRLGMPELERLIAAGPSDPGVDASAALRRERSSGERAERLAAALTDSRRDVPVSAGLPRPAVPLARPVPAPSPAPRGAEVPLAGAQDDKLSWRRDAAGPSSDRREQLERLEKLRKRFETELAAEETLAPGRDESREVRSAKLDHFKEVLEALGKSSSEKPKPQAPLRGLTEQEKKIEKMLGEIDGLKQHAQQEVKRRDAAAGAMAAADKARALVLRDRRAARELMDLRKDHGRLAMATDLAYSLDLLSSAEEALNGMVALLDAKIAKIRDRKKDNVAGAEQAKLLKEREKEWKDKAQADVDEDTTRAKDFANLSRKTKVYVQRIQEFDAGVLGLVSAIDDRDRGQSSSALAEYQRRLDLLPSIKRKLSEGGEGNGVDDLSLARLKDELAKLQKDLDKFPDALRKISEAGIETAGVLVLAVPGIPETRTHNPSVAQILEILAARKVHWLEKLDEIKETRDSLAEALGDGTGRRTDDFGVSVPKSLKLYRKEQKDLLDKLTAESDRFMAAVDELSAKIRASFPSASLPPLSGRSADELRDFLPAYADQIDTLNLPGDTDEGFDAKMNKIAIGRLLPFLGDATIRRIEAEQTIKTLDEAISDILPPALEGFEGLVAALQAVIDDVDRDVQYVNDSFPVTGRQALIDRKSALISQTLQPALIRVKALLIDKLIPFQEDRIAQSDPDNKNDSLALLYEKKIEVYTRIKRARERTLPWGLVTDGAREGDTATALANLKKLRDQFVEYEELIDDLLDQIRRRKDPVNCGEEELYGEMVPYSLVCRAKKYYEEKKLRAGQLNARAREINGILKEMDRLSKGVHNLHGKYALPEDVSVDAPGDPDRLRKLADDKVIENMADAIEAIADAAADEGGEISIGGGEGGGIPSGTQPDAAAPDSIKLALLGRDAVVRLVPTIQAKNGTSFAEVLARFLFSNGLMNSANSNLNVRIPIFEEFLAKAETVLNEVFADFDADTAYVTGDGSGGPAVLARKAKVYSRISETAQAGAELFTTKAGWSAEGFSDTADVVSYYDTLGTVYDSGNEALDADEEAAQEFKDKLAKSQADLARQKKEVKDWLGQLDPAGEGPLTRMQQDMSALQDRTRAVLERNYYFREAEQTYKDANASMEKALAALSAKQKTLDDELNKVGDLGTLRGDLADKIWASRSTSGAWLAAAPGGPQTLIIPKSQFGSFLSQLFSTFTPDSASRDIVALRAELLKNPMALSQLIPRSKMIEMGQGSDGFYLVYQTEFSSPNGLETAGNVTLGNLFRTPWGDNISVSGYRFASPPSRRNAPFGDQGIDVQVESLQGKNWVNYLNVTFHKFIQDIPSDLTVQSQARQSRMMIFEDFALMLADGNLYFGAAGFGDFALSDTKEKPYYYGGNFKASLKFAKVMTLNAEESLLFAQDPRKFFQRVNLDFTGYDPDLNQDFIISAEGKKRDLRREKVGVGVDVGSILASTDAFKVDFFFARVTGNEEINQNSVGATVLKGFSFDVAGLPANLTLSGTGELGREYNTASGRVAFTLPNQGLVLSAQGKIIGDAETYLLELRKKVGTNSDVFVSYGSQYIGLNHRLTIGMNTSFTLGELWAAVAQNSAEALQGGESLKGFNQAIDDFFKRQESPEPLLEELQRVFASDVGRKLLSLSVGALSRDLADLRKAGALLDNIHMRGMVGFVTNPVGTGAAEKAVGGGFQSGVSTEYTMTKSQKALIEAKIGSIFAEGLALQVRLLELSKAWQLTVSNLVQARWEMSLAAFMAANAQEPVLRAEAQAKLAAAKGDYRQAALRYNALTGRGPDEALPFDNINPADMDKLFEKMRQALGHTERLAKLFESLHGKISPPEDSFNLMDWIPWVEKLTFYAGIQLHDLLANQVIGIGVSIRLPIYDPASGRAEKALVLENQAVIREMLASLRSTRMRAESELAEARAWHARASELESSGQAAADGVADAIRQYRNGLIAAPELWSRFRRWYWTMTEGLRGRATASLKAAWSVLDMAGASRPGWEGRLEARTWESPKTLEQGVELAVGDSLELEALALRSQAARELMEAASNRVQKVSVDLNVGVNITAAGVALIPALGVTGLGIFPIFNVDLNSDELIAMSRDRREGEAEAFESLARKVDADVALQMFQAYASYRTGQEALAVYEREVLPSLSGHALDQARQRYRQTQLQTSEALTLLNFLMGRPQGLPLKLDEDLDRSFERLSARLAAGASARASVLRARIKTARSVEKIIDDGLRTQSLRFEPISLIGRSLGRLVNALSGDGKPSPELMAIARQQTLEAERALEGYAKGLPALRARLAFELEQARRKLEQLEGGTDSQTKLERVVLKGQIQNLRALLTSFGGSEVLRESGSAALPQDFDSLSRRLREAFAAQTIPPSDDAAPRPYEEPLALEAKGALRYFNLRRGLDNEPIGKTFTEGWIEFRLRSAATPPEALAALAKLRQERSEQLHRAEQARARAEADILLSRLVLDASLLRAAPPGLKADAERRLRRDYAAVAGRLGLGPDASLEGLLALLPRSEARDLEAIASEHLRKAASLDTEFLRRTLFQDGLPPELSASPDPILQLRAGLIAEKMSFKGFTPVGALGHFQGRWVGGFFLEAPDPIRVQKTLEGIVSDALLAELKSQDRLKALGLKLHSLMASVADKVNLVGALRDRLVLARRALPGALARARHGMAEPAEVEAARGETAAAEEEFIRALTALRMDFISLVAELEALDVPARYTMSNPLLRPAPEAASGEKDPQKELLEFWSRRLLDETFKDGLMKRLSAASSARDELGAAIEDYHRAAENATSVRHMDFSASERFELLTKVDLEGRRQKVELLLARILGELAAQDGPRKDWSELLGFLQKDLDAQKDGAAAEQSEAWAMKKALRGAYWGALDAPAEVREAYERLSDLSERAAQAKIQALAQYLRQRKTPEDYLAGNRALDEYLRALTAYDEEVARALESPGVGGQPRWFRAMNATFGVRESLDRLSARARHGRGILAIDATLELAETRLRALRWEGAGPDETGPVSETYAQLLALRQRWIEKPEEIPSLYRVEGVEQWLTAKEIKKLKDAGRRIATVDGRTFLLPELWAAEIPKTLEAVKAAGGREILGGPDAEDDLARGRETGARDERLKRSVEAALERADLALVRDGGQGVSGIGLQDLRRLESEGRVYYFEAKPDLQGKRKSVHPLLARDRDPSTLVIVAQTWGPRRGRDAFPTLEALEANEKGDDFERVELGLRGARALVKEAQDRERDLRRQGWLHLKLEGYGAAVDGDGNVVAVYMKEKEFEEALKKAEAGKRHVKSADLRLGLDENGELVKVEGAGLALAFGEGPRAWISGELFALELDGGRVERHFGSREQVEREAASWWIEDMEGKVWKQTDRDISPIHRLRRYIDPKTGLPVALGRAFLVQRLDEAKSESRANERWSYMPYNWPNILLETPRGIVKIPVELAGRDPNHEGYIGRVYMRQGEGGETENRGFWGDLLHFVDIFELFPDKVGRYHDPSQFPKRVNNDGPLLPGEWEHEKDPVSVDGEKQVHFGAGALLRQIRYAREDREDARHRILASFEGGARRITVGQVRGRNGDYAEASVKTETGSLAVQHALRELGGSAGADGRARIEEETGHIAVSRVDSQVELSLGARQHAERIKTLEAYLRRLEGASPAEGVSSAAQAAMDEALSAVKPAPLPPGFPAAAHAALAGGRALR